MDPLRFDSLAKTFGAASTRRRALAGLLGLGLAGLHGSERLVAKKKPKKPKRCKKSTCATGCCALGTCVVGEFEVCGTNGEACISCRDAVGLSCTLGRCECRPGRGCCIRDKTVPTPDPCTACCSGSCSGGDPINGCAES
jgi:hypothetical protein